MPFGRDRSGENEQAGDRAGQGDRAERGWPGSGTREFDAAGSHLAAKERGAFRVRGVHCTTTATRRAAQRDAPKRHFEHFETFSRVFTHLAPSESFLSTSGQPLSGDIRYGVMCRVAGGARRQCDTAVWARLIQNVGARARRALSFARVLCPSRVGSRSPSVIEVLVISHRGPRHQS